MMRASSFSALFDLTLAQRFLRLTCGLLILASLTGCSTVAFYAQSVSGHTQLMLSRIPIEEALQHVSEVERERLEQVPEILLFAEQEVGLPAKGSYTSFVPLDRDYPVYVVTAAPEFDLEPATWCYLVIGCASYRGYFSEQAAREFADKLATQQGLEVWVRGASAYSTLGWFNDPLLPTMLRYGEVYLVELLIHELTHQRIYLSGGTDFNEALASAVAEIATATWLAMQGETSTKMLSDYTKTLAMREDFDELLFNYKQGLKSLFARYTNDSLEHTESQVQQLRQEKSKLYRDFLNRYERFKSEKWQGDSRYDAWVEQGMNNARLSGFSSYREQVSDFKSLIERCDGSFARFFERLERDINHDDAGQPLIPTECQD